MRVSSLKKRSVRRKGKRSTVSRGVLKTGISPLGLLAQVLEISEIVLILRRRGTFSPIVFRSSGSLKGKESRALLRDALRTLRGKPFLPIAVKPPALKTPLAAWARKSKFRQLLLMSVANENSNDVGVLLAASSKSAAISPAKIKRLQRLLSAANPGAKKKQFLPKQDLALAAWLASQIHATKPEKHKRRKSESKPSLNIPPAFLKSLPSPPPTPLLSSHEKNIVPLASRAPGQNFLRNAQTMGAVSRISRKLAHEFNNYLSVILGYSSLLQIKLGSATEYKEELDGMQRAGDSATELTSKLLALGRLYQSASVHPLDLKEFLPEHRSTLREILGPRVETSLEIDRNLPYVHADPRQIRELLIQVAHNAADAMPQGGRFRLAARGVARNEIGSLPEAIPGDRWLLLEVSDSGCGMSSEVVDRIFEPFFTTKSDRNAEGIGCTIIYSIVHSHKGWLDIESAVGDGTTFRIYLPVD